MTKYEQYEREKRRLQSQNLPPKEYERKIRELCRKLGV